MSEKRNPLWKSLVCALLGALLFFLFFQFLYQADNKYTAGAPYGRDGHFAFTAADLERGRPLFLIDGWTLYADRALTPDALSGKDLPPAETVFIGQYPNFSFLSPGHSAFGEATYRLTLDYSGPPLILALEIPEIFTDYTLWINGQAVTEKGTSVSFTAAETTELLLSVKNQSHYYSGLTYPPALGLPQTISQMFLVRYLFYGLLCIFPLALCLYAAAGALRGRDTLFLHFGLLCFFAALQCAHPFMHGLGLSGRLWYAVEDMSRLLVLYCAVVIAAEAAGFAQKSRHQKIVRAVCMLFPLLSGAAVLFILPNFAFFIKLYGNVTDLYKLLCWLYLLFCALWGLYKKRGGAGLVLFGTAVLGASMAVNLLDSNRFEPIYTGWQTEYAGFFLILIFWVLTVQHTRALLRQNRRLTGHLEEEVRLRTTELNAVLQERKAFFSDLAHNLKAPMAAVQGFTQLILRGNVRLDAELQANLAKISDANSELARRMQVLGEINAFDKLTETAQPLDVDALLAQVYTDNAPETIISGIHLIVERLPAPAQIFAPREKMLLLFENLIYNALSFTPEDGTITLCPRLEGDELVLTVSDTGAGIAPEHLPHIFERFYVGRADKTEGSGLGLYIVQLILHEIGGSISAQSAVGKGTAFTLRIPLLK